MKLHTLFAAALTSACVLAPDAAPAWWSWNRHEVFPIGGGVWEVVSEVGAIPQDYWCATGDYAFRELGAPLSQRIYIWRGIGPSLSRPRRNAVQFSFSPPPGADLSPRRSLNIKAVGNSKRTGSAYNQCFNRRLRNNIFLD
ncbi:hypothetical protein [Cribrihabitans pelagius]|uniref:hypothetical protein n=1 Tax=Cribrihabitans pelagius TaxID=1765746 RepID=UPI003B5927C9